MNVRDVMSRLATLQASLAITDPVTLSIAKAYQYFPDAAKAIPVDNLPCWINMWTLDSIGFGSALQRGNFSVHSQLLVKPTETDVAADIATAFWAQFLAAVGADMKLGGSSPVYVKTIRGADPTLAALTFGGMNYVGLDLYLDLGINAGQVLEP